MQTALVNDFEFWPLTSKWWKIPNPVVVGFTGGSNFDKAQTGYLESVGTPVTPASLYEAQLVMRLHKRPDWVKSLIEIHN